MLAKTMHFYVTNAFYEFQRSILQQKRKLSIEDNIHHAMAINSILLLSPNYSLSQNFCEASLKATINKIKYIYGLNSPRMEIETVTNMISIIQDLDIEAISRSQAIAKLLELDILPNERNFANSLAELVKKLPRVPIAEDVNESELNTRFIDPFLCGLVNDLEERVFLRWTNDIAFEARKNKNLWTCCPDLTITSLNGVKWSTSHGYCEVKSAYHETNNFFDQIRVAKFCKNALDAQNMEGILGLEIIGRSITFYLLVLPNTLDDLRKLLMDMPLGLLVLDAFHRLCIRSINIFQPSQHHPTDRNRSCHLKKYN
ncbi:hypothetical protein CLU79DRAFT_805338 [Phycomyces nitens]|nr:hypothetical protein CLU79DRAFT_805338 [Phycomyces nitens]